jgi:hypothetical protein
MCFCQTWTAALRADTAERTLGQCNDKGNGVIVDMMTCPSVVRGECRAESMCMPTAVPALCLVLCLLLC